MENDRILAAVAQLIKTIHRLRAPGGCPWDREQTHQSLRPYLIEEAHEVLTVLDQVDSPEKLKDPQIASNLKEELGDLLMQILLHSEMVSEQGVFDFGDVAQSLDDKLVRRHPHVFGEVKAKDAHEAVKNWEQQKQAEKSLKSATASVLDGLPRSLPALQRAERMIEKVTRVGFQWKDWQGPLDKVREELGELETEITRSPQDKKRIESELGDALFTLANLGFLAGVHPEDALRGMLDRFQKRFHSVEQSVKSSGRDWDDFTLDELDHYWEAAKKHD